MHRVSAADTAAWDSLDEAALVGFHMDGDRPPLVLIRTWTNEVFGHAQLAGVLGTSQPLVSIGVDMTATDFPRSVEEWADRVMDTVRLYVDPDRALLGGFSFGGVVALEVAERMRRAGTRPLQVVLIDSSLPRPKTRARPGLALVTARKVVRVLEDSRDPGERARELLAAAGRAPRIALIRSRRSLERRRDRVDGVNESSMPHRQRSIYISYLRYEPVPLDLPATILVTEESVARADNDRCLGWSRLLTGPVCATTVAGQHFSMLQPDNAWSAGQALEKVLVDI